MLVNNRRTGFCIPHGNGNGFSLGVPADFIECISGSDAYNTPYMVMHRIKEN